MLKAGETDSFIYPENKLKIIWKVKKGKKKGYQKGICLANTPDGCSGMQRHIKKLGKWAGRNTLKFNSGRLQVQPPERNQPRLQGRLGAAG